MNPANIPLTAVTAPFGLYKWVMIPMGLWNAPAIHQCHVVTVLRNFIGKSCHVYLDDIVIWSQTVEEHRMSEQFSKHLKKHATIATQRKCTFSAWR